MARNSITIEGAKIFYYKSAHNVSPNFSGIAQEYNAAGNRNFTMFIDDEDLALRMKDEGWNVQILEARPDHPDDSTKYFINATIKFSDRYGNPLRYQPKVYIVNNNKVTPIGEKALGTLDEKQIKYIDVVLNPSVKDDGTFKAYVNELYVVVEESRLHDKYAVDEYPEDDLSPEDDPFGM